MSMQPALGVRFTIQGKPRQYERVRRDGRSGRWHNTRKYDATKEIVAVAARQLMQGRPPFPGAVVCVYHCWRAIPKSYSKIKRAACLSGSIRPIVIPDLDNYVKMVMDACNNIIYLDDAQIVDMIVRKWFGDPPRITVIFTDWIGK